MCSLAALLEKRLHEQQEETIYGCRLEESNWLLLKSQVEKIGPEIKCELQERVIIDIHVPCRFLAEIWTDESDIISRR